jgi:hypothetical protein
MSEDGERVLYWNNSTCGGYGGGASVLGVSGYTSPEPDDDGG